MADANASDRDTEAPNLPATTEDQEKEEKQSSTGSVAPSPGTGEIGGPPNSSGKS